VFGLGLSFKNQRLELQCKIWQCAHLWCQVATYGAKLFSFPWFQRTLYCPENVHQD